MSDSAAVTDPVGSLPQPDPLDTVRSLLPGRRDAACSWRRLVPAGLCAIALHGFFLSLLGVITVVFPDPALFGSGWTTDPDAPLVVDPSEGLIEFDRNDLGQDGVDTILGVTLLDGATTPGAPLKDDDGQKRLDPRDDNGKPSGRLLMRPITLLEFVSETMVGKAGEYYEEIHVVRWDGVHGTVDKKIVQPASSIPGPGGAAPDVPYVPTPETVVDRMLQLAGVREDEIVFDLGCGDGRIPVTAAVDYGAVAFGYDIDPARVKESRELVKKNGVENQVVIQQRDIFKLDLSGADVVTLYLLPSLNVKLIPQLQKMKPGSRIVSHDFDMEGIKPDKVVDIDVADDNGNTRTHKLYLWTTPLKKE